MKSNPVSVWAPGKKEVVLVTPGKKYTLSREKSGWWTGPSLKPDTTYSFLLDGEGQYPDPRSLRQPEGVHGPSQKLDFKAYNWTDTGWQPPPLSSAIIYELHTGTFTPKGTFQAAEDKLPHLKKLGINYIELMPVNGFSGNRGWGYDGVNLYAPHETYGGPEGLAHFVNTCHQNGFAVILDVVYNHLGPEGNYLEKFGPYFTDKYSTNWGKAVNFDGPESDAVRAFFIENALHWLSNYRIDALRIDAVHAIYDFSTLHFLEELAGKVSLLNKTSGRLHYLIAESDLNDPRIINSPSSGGYGLDAQWSDDFHHALHALLTGEQDGYYSDFGRYEELAKVFNNPFVYSGNYSNHRKRRHGRDPGALNGEKFLAYIQNHDQIGNRARGDRISHITGSGSAKIAAALVLLSPYIPMIFQGEEWGASSPFCYFTDHGDPELGTAVSKGRRGEFASFGWDPEDIPDPQSEKTFNASKLCWEEIANEPHSSIFEWYGALIDFRNKHPELLDMDRNKPAVKYNESAGWFFLIRKTAGCLCNFFDKSITVPKDKIGHFTPAKWSSPDGFITEKGDLMMPPKSVCLLVRKTG